MFPHKQDSHFQAVPGTEKRKKAQSSEGPVGGDPAPKEKAPSRVANRASASVSPLCGAHGHLVAAPGSGAVLSSGGDPGCCHMSCGDRILAFVLKNLM